MDCYQVKSLVTHLVTAQSRIRKGFKGNVTNVTRFLEKTLSEL